MSDPRSARLAELLAGYSLDLKPGQIIRIDAGESAAPLILDLYRAALTRGALPYTNVAVDGLAEHLVFDGSDEQITFISPIAEQEVELMDALVTLISSANTRSLNHADPERQQRYLATRRELSNRFWNRVSSGRARWCGTQFPDHAHAQDAEMSLREYEDFVYRACHVTGDDDPETHWRNVAAELTARAGEMEGVKELRVVGPDTDLRLVVQGRTWRPACGERNMPDGEVYTSPVEEGTEGEIRFTFPAVFANREVEDVRLRFEGGRVVQAEAARGVDYLRTLLDMDADARVVGEFAFGLNYEIDRFTRNILFDEKIGGTVHIALGSGFPDLGGRNRSGLHWDLICDLRAEGEVYADGELIWKAGQFLTQPVAETAGAR
jgi:aminopeptidase